MSDEAGANGRPATVKELAQLQIDMLGKLFEQSAEVRQELADFRVDTVTRLTALETAAKVSSGYAQEQATGVQAERNLRWMKIGIALSFAVGIASAALRIFGV